MKKPLLEDGKNHFHFNAALSNAKDRAMRDPTAILNMYYDGVALFVRDQAAVPPRNGIKVCDIRKDGDEAKVTYVKEDITWTKITL
jgi:hypothetical protein